MSAHTVLGHEVEIDLSPGDIITGLVLAVQIERANAETSSVDVVYAPPAARVMADGLLFHAYHLSAQNLGGPSDE